MKNHNKSNKDNKQYEKALEYNNENLYNQFHRIFFYELRLNLRYGYFHDYYSSGCTYADFITALKEDIDKDITMPNFYELNNTNVRIISAYMEISVNEGKELLNCLFVRIYNGYLFEESICNLLKENGFNVYSDSRADNDYKIDIIVEKYGIKVGLQCKSETYFNMSQNTKAESLKVHLKAKKELDLKAIYYMYHSKSNCVPMLIELSDSEFTYFLDTIKANSIIGYNCIDTYNSEALVSELTDIIMSFTIANNLPFNGFWLDF